MQAFSVLVQRATNGVVRLLGLILGRFPDQAAEPARRAAAVNAKLISGLAFVSEAVLAVTDSLTGRAREVAQIGVAGVAVLSTALVAIQGELTRNRVKPVK